jgi:hypothetical protein
MTKAPKDIAASVRERLLHLARKRGDDFQLLLVRYANERLLYRLARSQHRDSFVLKGATLFTLWTGRPHRATRDVDLARLCPATLAATVLRAQRVPITMYCSGSAVGDTVASSPAAPSAARISPGGSRCSGGGPCVDSSLKSTMATLPPGRNARASARA